MKKYTTYEEPFVGKTFMKRQLRHIYNVMVRKDEYPTFPDWIYDMVKSGVFEEVK